MNNKRGSSSVFLALILATLVSIAFALIYSVREESVKSRVDALVSLSTDSILSEYDAELQEEYGLFLMRGRKKELSGKMRKYVSYSIGNMKNVSLQKAQASGENYMAVDHTIIKDQIIEYMKYAKLKNVVVGGEVKAVAMNDMRLEHQPTIISLPSRDLPAKSLTVMGKQIADQASDVKGAFKEGTDKYLINSYALGCFNRRTGAVDQEHFFKNEVEYILGGEFSDKKNEKRVEMALQAMRLPLNLAHIYADDAKRTAVITMAEIMTPGAAAAATQLVIATTWAYAEADNDVKLLWQGKKVPMIKGRESWALDLDSVMDERVDGVVNPPVNEGYTYDEYLQILLFFQDENIQVARIMDLIQINTRMKRDGTFVIQECFAGIHSDVKVNNREFGYEKKY